MIATLRSPKEFWLGIIYSVVGGTGFLMGREYLFGSGARMGPGYFPTIVSALLFAFGLVAVARAFVFQGGPVGKFAWKACALVLGSVAMFGLLLPRAGFVVAGVLLLFTCALASTRFHLTPLTCSAAVALVAACSLVFIAGLGVQMPAAGLWLEPFLLGWTGN